ncbi:MAG: hypothetical protein MJ048_02070 [Acidaminococcaceae bacterium]|nr:hypothetical protein [Acidaminococcaceae bacterium]MDO4936228.1 hypothetical protein [Phascolarctobacterium sp.]
MKLDKQQKELVKDIEFAEQLYKNLIKILPSFNVTDKKVLPYGLKPHTRSVSWLVEQVITQQSKYHCKELGLEDVNFDMPDTCLHDCIVRANKKNYYINIKAHNYDGKENQNDIAAVEKLYMNYKECSEYNVIYVCVGIHFEGIKIVFDEEYLKVFTAQFLPIYVNPRNDKIQAKYSHTPILRSRKQFLDELANSSMSIKLR